MWRGTSLLGLTFFFFFFASLLFIHGVRSQNQGTTPPSEVSALSAIFQKWDLSGLGTWDSSTDPCKGQATDFTPFEDDTKEQFIKCMCSNGICHITQLKIVGKFINQPIPNELKDLPSLFNLNLSRNYLTGPLPAFIGNLSDMRYLNLFMNNFSETVPKELGNLKNLNSLALGANNFNGPLPPELGDLTSLKQLYIESCGVSGEIPSTFARLQNLTILWASDNNFTGKIPDFVGGFTNLTTLRLQGNSFQGPIPLSFANLTKLTDLRIGDLIDGGSSLTFVQKMKSLSTLILRNSMISGTIPPFIGDYVNLTLLDLSFNSLTGELPESLFTSARSLNSLLLGSNNLSGNLPNRKSPQLVNIDLSYNNFSGSFPTWVSEGNLQLNLVFNNFVIDSSTNRSSLLFGLGCLQKNVPCGGGSPRSSSFAINCGGKQIRISDGTTYEMDNENLTKTPYYVSPTKWGVSSAGWFVGTTSAAYIQETKAKFVNTIDSSLFQTARVSPSSLRYYGLDLENGNYNVKLQFAEIAFDKSNWTTIGRRIFNIYIQGELVAKDFDIRKEAGDPLTATEKEFDATVTSNFLEIHFFWAGKGTCCIPTSGTYGPSISAISVNSNLLSNRRNWGLIVGIVVSVVVLCALLVLGILVWTQKKSRPDRNDDEDLHGLAIKPDIFSYAELRTATEDFHPTNKLGEGGFGPVFKGKLSDGRSVAVKQLSVASHQGKLQFVTEIATISAVQHRNLVKLYGCCIEGNRRLLVYEYLENKSLDQALFGESCMHLDWPSRFAICLNTARGLAYLHEESSVRIVHRDVKASNILLDSNLNPKISDFGLAKLYDDNKTHISTKIAGTIGYLAPEYAMRGHLTEKADIYGFGVAALEIVSGRPNTDTSLIEEKVYLLEWAWHLHENKRELELVDPKLLVYNEEEAIRMIKVALLCTQTTHLLRPPMSRVVSMLAGDIEVVEVSSRHGTDWQFKDMRNMLLNKDISGASSSDVSGSQFYRSSGGWSGIESGSSQSDSRPMLR